MASTWQRRRSEFNHDWLKNRYLPALGKWLNLLDERIEDPIFEATFIDEVLPQWKERGTAAKELVRDFESYMSPRNLLNCPPLKRYSRIQERWLGQVVHELWLTRYPVRQWIDAALAAIEQADAAYAKVQQYLTDGDSGRNIEDLRRHRNLFADLRERCQVAARALEVFSSKIDVI